MGIFGAEWAKKSEEGIYPIMMEASVPKIGTKFKDRMKQGEKFRSRNEGN
jgi:hypothetical protein